MSVLLYLLKEESYRPPAVAEGIMEQKRQAAIEWMGTRWMCHPQYVYNPKHRIYRTEDLK